MSEHDHQQRELPAPGLRLYDTLQAEVRPFVPAGETVSLYVCGITPYDATHLGHAFTFIAFDVLIRYLRYLGLPVRYVQNVTDIDDPLYARAAQLGVSFWDLAAGETEQYLADMLALNAHPPDVFPRASQEIPDMIDLVARLIQAGTAYQVDGHVYFSIAADPEYGKLSRLGREQMIAIASERGGNPDDPLRRDPLDFVLWRPAGRGEPRYASPWGEGLPGWHIECSTMSLKYLGEPLDIHGGGVDLVFPHHESEIAQSEAATEIEPFARWWMHTGMVYMDGAKMSKSLGNMVFVRDLVPRYGADALRLYLAGCHYRASLYYREADLERTGELARHLAMAAETASDPSGSPLDPAPYRARFLERMADDLDTPGAVEALQALAEAVLAAPDRDARTAQAVLRELADVLGLGLNREQ